MRKRRTFRDAEFYDHKRALLAGWLFMLVGGTFMLGASVLINSVVKFEKTESQTTTVNFKVQPIEKTKSNSKRAQIAEARKPRKAASKSLDASPSALGDLPGLDFGLGLGQKGESGSIAEGMTQVDEDAVMSSDSLDIPPKALDAAPVEYPENARNEKLTGFVSVNILIADTGRVEKVVIQESEPNGVFDDVVLASVKNWKFEPGRYKGKAVKVWASQRIVFEGM